MNDSSHGLAARFELISPTFTETTRTRPSRAAHAAPPVPATPADPSYVLAEQDAVQWLRTLRNESVDLFVTDPPYESLEKHRAIGTTTRLKHSKASSNDWFRVFPNTRFPELFRELYRVLAKNRHFYLFSDAETMFIAKPIAEEAGFKFWKPLVWDKCLGPDTPVWTDRGVIHAKEVATGDRVATPDGQFVHVLARRDTTAPSVRIRLSNGTVLVASEDHRFVRADGALVEAGSLKAGDALKTSDVTTTDTVDTLNLTELVSEEARVLEMPDPSVCLFCGRRFEGVRAAAAHQARFCPSARSKADMAETLGVAAKRLRRWMSEGRIPATWARTLGLDVYTTGRSRAYLQNDSELWFPETLRLDYDLGRIVGLYAAEGHRDENAVTFALHADESTLAAFIGRFARSLGMRATLHKHGENGAVVVVPYAMMSRIIGAFVGGNRAPVKFFHSIVYAAPEEFRRGVLAGLLEGDGHWSHEEQRETLNVASLDLAAFALRMARERGHDATMRRFENDHAGGYRVRFDPRTPLTPVTVASVEKTGLTELVDIAIDHPEQLYILGDGVVTHNCKIGMGYHYRARHEFILFFEKGKRKLADLSVPDVIQAPRIHGGYPTEKPVSVSELLVRQSTQPGEVVADPFMGSGSTGVAALTLGRRFYGTDIAQAALDLTKERLERVRTGGAPSP